MKLTLLHKILSIKLSVFAKSVVYKKGSLMLVSIPVSVGFLGVIHKLLRNVDEFHLILPIITIVLCIAMYFVFFIVDLLSGLIASKHKEKNNPDWVKSDKLYSSLGKIGGVLLIDILLLSIILFLVVIGFNDTSVGFLIIAVMLNVLAITYEIHSIGENIKKRTNKKPRYFSFFEKITTLLEEKIINRISNKIGGEDYE